MPEPPQIEPLNRAQLLLAIALTALVLLIIARLWLLIDTVQRLPLIWNSLSIGVGIGMGIGITLASILTYRFWSAYRHSAEVYLQFVLKPLHLTDTIWLSLLPGLSEELLFRGVMLPALGLNLLGVVLTSVCFGGLHMSGLKQWPYMAWATVIGLILGVSAVVSGNLLVPIVAHVTTNLLSSIFWKRYGIVVPKKHHQ